MTDTLMVGVAGVRGIVGKDLTPEVVTRWATAFGAWVRERAGDGRRGSVVLGRDARASGPAFAAAVATGLTATGCDVIDVGLVPTPTVQLAVEHHRAAGGIAITASHNPIEWNGLKFIGPDGIFLDGPEGGRVHALLAQAGGPEPRELGRVTTDGGAVERHLAAVLALPAVDVERIRGRGFTVALDTVRGAGGPVMRTLLERLGCRVRGIHLETDGRFPRAPEPVPEHLGELAALVRPSGAAVGFAVDPDVDRLAIVDETGVPIGEDYTLAFAVRAVLGEAAAGTAPSPSVVCNLSTSLVVEDAARACGATLVRTPVAAAPRYVIVKAKVPRGAALERVYGALRRRFADAHVDTQDGLRLAWGDRWLHVRPSNTEPIIRLIAEAPSGAAAQELVDEGRRLCAAS